MKLTKGPFAGYKVEFAESTQVQRNEENLDTLLRIMGWELDEVFISDQSSVGDFLTDESDVKEVSDKLGFEITRRDLLYEIAMRMKKAN